MQPRDPRSFDHVAGEFDFWASLERRPDFFVQRLPHRRTRALDIGCGSGILAFELARHFTSVVGIDISQPMLEIARRNRSAANIEYRRQDVNLLVLNEKFDLIVSHTTFHHLKDIPKTLNTLKAALQPGGRLILVDNYLRWRGLLRYPPAFRIGTLLNLPFEIRRHGIRNAWRLFLSRLSSSWVEHVRRDFLLSEQEFREIYGQALPSASFARMKYFMGVVWDSPTGGAGKDIPLPAASGSSA